MSVATANEDVLCPLCNSVALFLQSAHRRDYYWCTCCDLVHVPAAFHVAVEVERARYDLHRNLPDDAGYVTFLNRLVVPLAERVRPGAEGLDFGSGPCPVLADLLRARGFRIGLFDPLYHPDRAALERDYDFVTVCETVEHFRNPAEEWPRLVNLLRSGGWLAVMTEPHGGRKDLSRWRYANDITHIGFYSERTFEWLAVRCDLESVLVSSTVTMMRRK